MRVCVHELARKGVRSYYGITLDHSGLFRQAGLQWLGISCRCISPLLQKLTRAFKASLSTIDILWLQLHFFWNPATWGFFGSYGSSFSNFRNYSRLKNCQEQSFEIRKHRKSVASSVFCLEPTKPTCIWTASRGGFVPNYFLLCHVCGEWRSPFAAVHGLLLSGTTSSVQVALSTGVAVTVAPGCPGSSPTRVEPVSPVLEDRFLSTIPPGKSFFFFCPMWFWVIKHLTSTP